MIIRDRHFDVHWSKRRVRLTIDHEYPAEPWWLAAREKLNWFPPCVQPLIGRHTEAVVVSWADFHAFLRVASAFVGWCDGPRFAPCPIAMNEVDPDAN